MVLPAAHVGHRQRRWPDPRPKPAPPQNRQTLVPRSTRHLEAGQSLADLSAIEQGLLWGLQRTEPHAPGIAAPIGSCLLRLLTGRHTCLLYTSDAADEEDSVDLGGR